MWYSVIFLSLALVMSSFGYIDSTFPQLNREPSELRPSTKQQRLSWKMPLTCWCHGRHQKMVTGRGWMWLEVTLWWTYKKQWKMAIEIVEFSHEKWVMFNCYVKLPEVPNYSHLIGIMISKTIGFRGTLFGWRSPRLALAMMPWSDFFKPVRAAPWRLSQRRAPPCCRSWGWFLCWSWWTNHDFPHVETCDWHIIGIIFISTILYPISKNI